MRLLVAWFYHWFLSLENRIRFTLHFVQLHPNLTLKSSLHFTCLSRRVKYRSWRCIIVAPVRRSKQPRSRPEQRQNNIDSIRIQSIEYSLYNLILHLLLHWPPQHGYCAKSSDASLMPEVRTSWGRIRGLNFCWRRIQSSVVGESIDWRQAPEFNTCCTHILATSHRRCP